MNSVLIKVLFCIFILLFFVCSVYSQTYTTSGLSTNWNDAAAWVKTNPDGCPTQNAANVPPLGPVWDPNCPIKIIINHPIQRAGNTNIGSGNMTSLTVNSGGEINFIGNLTVNNSGGNLFNFQVNDGGRFLVGGTLGIRAGATFNVVNASNAEPQTFVQVNNLTFLNAGSGQAVNVGENTVFNVINQTRLEGGGALNIQGEFNTNTLNSTNSGGSQMNVSGDGTIRATGNMQITGFPMNLSGNAGVVVGGTLTISNDGNSSLNLNGPDTNFIVLSNGSSIAAGKTPTGSCFQTPENGNSCSSSACLETIIIPGPDPTFERLFIFRCNTDWAIPGANENEEPVDEAEILIVAGGGGGGRGISAGGGGAGALIYLPSELLPFGNVVPVIVGKSGAGSTNVNARGNNGGLSSFLGLTADGGGGGGSTNSGVRTGNQGGSGGGGAASNNVQNDSNPGGTATGGSNENVSPGLGRNGGTGNRAGNSNNRGGGGGGGAVTAGGNGSGNNGGGGGSGIVRDIIGISITYAAGGGGVGNGSNGLGGIGVPGDATTRSGGNANGSGASRNGLADTGSGGGATSSGTAGNGSNGIVIVRQTFKILPVEYLYFEGNFRREERLAEIKWATGKEWENSHFELQRSMGNVKNWETIAKIEGVGWSDVPVEYSFKDKTLPLVGGLAYYRLKQVDFNGDSHLSKVIAIRIPSQQVTKDVWRVFPNPNSGDQFTLDLVDRSEYAGEDLRIRLISPTSGNYFLEGKDFREISEQIRKQLEKSPHGVYILEVSWGKKIEYIKVLRKSSSGS